MFVTCSNENITLELSEKNIACEKPDDAFRIQQVKTVSRTNTNVHFYVYICCQLFFQLFLLLKKPKKAHVSVTEEGGLAFTASRLSHIVITM